MVKDSQALLYESFSSNAYSEQEGVALQALLVEGATALTGTGANSVNGKNLKGGRF
jgi:hypothetical protein